MEQFFSTLLGLQLKGYEERKEQQAMARDVMHAFTEPAVALIEAGTGTGKSLGYLIPAILWAKQNNESVVISTNTIALQEQLIEKDIPLAMRVVGCQMKYILAKGMGNYLCLRKLKMGIHEPSLLQNEEHLAQIDAWTQHCKIGSRSELPFFPSRDTWEKVSAHPDTCNPYECSFASKCFFLQARREAQEAKIIVTNHHLLCADLVRRMETNNFDSPALLPAYRRLIVDEAHHLEDVATDYFAEKVSRLDLLKALALLAQERLLPLEQVVSHSTQRVSEQKNALSFLIGEFFDSCQAFCTLCTKEQKLRIRVHHATHPYWNETLKPRAEALMNSLADMTLLLFHVVNEVERLKNDSLTETIKNLLMDLTALQQKLSSAANRMKRFFALEASDSTIYWVEQELRPTGIEIALIQAKQDISQLLREYLFEKNATTVLCSATLATNASFSYIRTRMGLSKQPLEKIYPSPFAYNTQALFGCPVDMPEPDHSDFVKKLTHAIQELVHTSRGNAFVLFTSYDQLKNSYSALYEPLSKQGYHCMKQGDDHRHALIRRFKETPRSILFGTDSFWEGVDIQGDALRCVIITKLPFAVPSDPISEARCEFIAAKGGNPFRDYSLPRAVMKFKQAFGRLIRHKNDRGCCICLDVRLIKRGYGRLFVKSLPQCLEVFAPLAELKQKMREFYTQTSVGACKTA